MPFAVTAFPALQRVDFSNTPVENMAPLTTLRALTHLNGSRSRIFNLAPCTALQLLDFSHTIVADMGPVALAEGITHLDFRRTGIEDLTHVAHFMALRYLDCSRIHEIHDLSPLAALLSLSHLNASQTTISDRVERALQTLNLLYKGR